MRQSFLTLALSILAGSAACSEGAAPELSQETRDPVEEAAGRHGKWPFRRADGSYVLVDFDAQAVRELPVDPGAEVTGYAFDVPSGRLALLLAAGEVQVLDTTSGERVSSFRTGEIGRGPPWIRRWPFFAAGGTVVVLALGTQATELWSVAGAQRIASLRLEGDRPATARALDADGERIALGDAAGNLGIWNVRDGQVLHAAAIESVGITSLAFDPAGETLAVGADDAAVRLWQLEGSGEGPTLSHRDADVWGDLAIGSLAFSPEGSRLVSTSYPYWEARCWDVRSGEELWRYEGYHGGMESALAAAYSLDGARVVLSVRGVVLNAASGKVLHTLVPANGAPSDFGLGRDIAWLLHDGCLQVFSTVTGEPLFGLVLEPGSS